MVHGAVHVRSQQPRAGARHVIGTTGLRLALWILRAKLGSGVPFWLKIDGWTPKKNMCVMPSASGFLVGPPKNMDSSSSLKRFPGW